MLTILSSIQFGCLLGCALCCRQNLSISCSVDWYGMASIGWNG